MHSRVHSSTVYNSQIRKQLKCAVRDKQILTCVTHTRICFRPKKKKKLSMICCHTTVLPFATT